VIWAYNPFQGDKDLSKQNAPLRQGYRAVSVQVTSTAANLQALCETMLGLAAGQFGFIFREVTIQMDPVTSSALSCMFGNGNVGVTLNGVVQCGMVLGPTGGLADTIRAGTINGAYFGAVWAKAVTSTVVLNIQCFEI
jgi:hypothetical protein